MQRQLQMLEAREAGVGGAVPALSGRPGPSDTFTLSLVPGAGGGPVGLPSGSTPDIGALPVSAAAAAATTQASDAGSKSRPTQRVRSAA